MPGKNTRDDRSAPTDVGRTSGGGSLGHKAPPDVNEEGPIRNQPTPPRPKGDGEEDPVMPSNDSALNTKI